MELRRTKSNTLTDLKPLGAGGYGVVYKAEHAEWGVVAYKKLHSQYVTEKEENALKKEAEIQSGLSHPNIVKLLGVVFEPEHYGLVLEFMEIGEILDYVQNSDPPWELKLSMINDVVLGMSYLHSLNPPIIHGDLKTENILVGANSKAKICDFGFAEWKNYSASRSKKKVRLGTVSHVPPETWSDPFLRKNEKFDVYSIGICLWEIITGLKPFEVMIPGVIRESVLSNKRPDLKLIASGCPRTIIELIGQCWKQNAANRPMSNQIKDVIETEMKNMRRKSIKSFTTQEEPIIQQVTQNSNVQMIDSDDLFLLSECGNNVILGNYKHKNANQIVFMECLPIAKNTCNLKNDLMTEANLLSDISHPCIIEFLGVYVAWKKFIVMEYASMGPLDAFLQRHRTFASENIIQLMNQVAHGMAYLGEQRIIHCNLSAKNIFLVSEKLAKISGFRYSKKLPKNITRYQMDPESMVLNVDFNWSAPEIHLKNYFCLKSDSWDFGIALWEALANVSMPHVGVSRDRVISRMDLARGFKKPENCSSVLYNMLNRCWEYDYRNRPTFQEIISTIRSDIDAKLSSDSSRKLTKSVQQESISYECSSHVASSGVATLPVIESKNLIPITVLSEGNFAKKQLCRLKQNGVERLVVSEIYGDFELPDMNGKYGVMHQAKIIGELSHDSIIRVIGVCETDSQMTLIKEYALFGSLDDFLRQNPNTPIENIIRLMYQVAHGMAYLETNKVVLCCLAAKHILLVSLQNAKISNFEFAGKLDFNDSICIKDLKPVKRLLKGLASESLIKNVFTSKSDVFSFGIALWEAVSHGEDQFNSSEYGYEMLHGETLAMNKPVNCPDSVYNLMLECCCHIPEYRPCFKKIIWTFGTIFKQMNIQPFFLNSNSDQNFHNIDPSRLTILKQINAGCFGKNYIGLCQLSERTHQAVIVTADSENTLIALKAFTHELQIMLELSNKYIAENLGICVSYESVELVVQASELGSLRYFIENHKPVANATLLNLMRQVAQGMAYLEDNRILHLNLEASNIYLLSEHYATIGNFQLSKRLNHGEDYYCIETGKEFLVYSKWSAPEYIPSGKCDSKSDVWSYGSTVWEVLSIGHHEEFPFQMEPIYDFVGLSKPKPPTCSDKLYKFLIKCWDPEPNGRPGFVETVRIIGEEMYDLFCVKPCTLNVLGKLNDGDIGSIRLARYTTDSMNLIVTVENVIDAHDRINYLELMLKMRHECIVQFIGFCPSHFLARLTELPLVGRLDLFLAENQQISTILLHLICQVAQGMAHLERHRVVHLYLRASSIRLHNQNRAKICVGEFCEDLPSNQECIAINLNPERYREIKTHWRWAAPECLKYKTANSKSDIWSFGVVMWEVMSHGSKPYPHKTDDEFHASNNGESHLVLDKPPNCPQAIYELMLNCWRRESTDRPTFREIENFFSTWHEPITEILEDDASIMSKLVTEYHLIDSARIKINFGKIISVEQFGFLVRGEYYSPDGANARTVEVRMVFDPKDNFEASKQFADELRMMSMLNKKEILDFIGICDGSEPMLVLEFAEFGSIREFLSINRETPMERVLTLMHQVADGMEYMRTRRVVHRNLKATNILLTTQVQAKISDFKFSKHISEGVEYCYSTERLSFNRWTAPECFTKGKFYFESDVFSFGVALWEATSYGATPHAENTDAEVEYKILNNIVLSRSLFCPVEIYNLMIACWRTNGKLRPKFEDMKIDLANSNKYCVHLK